MLDFKSAELEVKEVSEEGVIEGYASIYNTVDKGGDIVMPGAFTASIKSSLEKGRKIKMLWQHDPTQPIGVWDTLQDDQKGLRVRGRILDSIARGKEAITLVRAGAIGGLSIGYRTSKENYRDVEKGVVREIMEAELWETSLVTFPMHPDAEITDVKNLQSMVDVERILRKAGVPGGFAKLVARHGFEEAQAKLTDGPRDEDGHSDSSKELKRLLAELNGITEVIHAQR